MKAQKIFGVNVKKKRRELGLSQEQLAEKIERDPRSIVAIEAGNRNATFSTIYKLCLALKVKASELLPF